MNKIIIIISLLVIGFASFFGYKTYINPPSDGISTNVFNDAKIISPSKTGFKIEAIATGLFVPRGIIQTSADRLIFTERNGKISEIQNGIIRKLYEFPEVSTTSEEGLMGIAMPKFGDNRTIFVAIAYKENKSMFVKIVSFIDDGINLSSPQIVIDKLPAAQYHAGGRIKFGPDNRLYVSVGDAFDKNLSQNTGVSNGKILRLNADGTIPSDNPFSGSAIRSYGHRNIQGIDRDSSGQLFVSEHGPSIIDGPPGGDEINKIFPGKNYGWPLVSHLKTLSGTESPLAIFTPAIAPGSLMIYKGEMFPEREGKFFMGGLVAENIYIASFDGTGYSTSTLFEQGTYGRIRDIFQGSDGSIYFTTSNEDGRGTKRPEKDAIYRIFR